MTDLAHLKAAIPLSDLISQQHTLIGSGRYRHGQQHDSLVVDTDQNEYWWNSKGEWGDTIDWVGRYLLGYDGTWSSQDPAMFKEAVAALARLAGQPEPQFKPEDPQTRQRRLTSHRLFSLATDHYQARFADSEPARTYAAGRGWTEETAQAARLGFSDGKLIDQIPQADRRLAIEIGLLAERNGRIFDAIPAGCLVYPHQVRGRICYLSGRSIEDKKHYNLYAPKEMFWAIRGGYGNDLVIVEGQADALSLAQWGLAGLALCGVNLAALDHDLLKLFNRIFVAIDHDQGGLASLDKLGRAISPLIRLVTWPDDLEAKDVNDLLQAGVQVEQFQAWLARAETYLDYAIRSTLDAAEADWDAEIEKLFELLAMLDNFPLTRYRAKVCDRLGFNRVDFDRLLSIAKNENDAYKGFLKGDQFAIQQGWTIWKQHNQNGRITPVPLANGSFQIAELVERDNGSGDTFKEYVIKGELTGGKTLPACNVPTREFSSMSWVAEYWPEVIIGAGRSTHDLLREAIQHLSGDIPRRVVYEHTGWRTIEGQWCYLTSAGALGLQKTEVAVEVDLSMGRPNTYVTLYNLPQPAEVSQAILSSLSFWNLTDYTQTIPQWAAAYLAPLIPLLPADFGLWVHGKSGSFKSVIAALALCHFGDWTGREAKSRLPANFISTANSILMNAFVVKDCLLVIDDFSPGNTVREMRERDEVASRLLRSVGNRAARGRMLDGRRFQADFPPRCLALITAEDIPPGQSILARGIGVRVYTPPRGTPERATIETRLHQAQQVEAARYRHAMAAYILWLQRHWDDLAEKLPVLTIENQRKFATDGHARLADAFGKLMAAIDTALFFFQDAGAITTSQAQERRSIAFEALVKVMAEHAGQIEALDPCLIFTETLREELDAGTWYLAPAEPDQIGDSPQPHYSATRIGYTDDNYIYLLPKAVSLIIESHNRLGTPFPVGRNTLYHRLQERGWLVRNGTKYIAAMSTSPHILQILRSAIYPEEEVQI